MMRTCTALLASALAAAAQQAPSGESRVTIPAGVPLRVALEHRVRIRHVNDRIEGTLIEPVYLSDRVVMPAGSHLEGHIASIGGVPFGRRLGALLSGNFSPTREVSAQFDTVILKDGSHLSIRSQPSAGTAHTARVSKHGKPVSMPPETEAMRLAFRTPGKWRSLENYLMSMLPYRPQAWNAGTLFAAELMEPLSLTAPETTPDARTRSGDLRARLVTRIDSGHATRGMRIEAIVTRPQFSQDGRLQIAEGTRLVGEVIKAQKARFLHRNGKLLFTFREIERTSAPPESIQGYLDGVEADWSAHLTLDAEGTAQPTALKSRLIFPAIASTVAGLSFHQDFNAKGVPDADSAGRAESGAVGLGLIGTVLAQIGPRPEASALAILGAAASVYRTFLARGEDVILPANTVVTVTIAARP